MFRLFLPEIEQCGKFPRCTPISSTPKDEALRSPDGANGSSKQHLWLWS
jgi:hypothetical protein